MAKDGSILTSIATIGKGELWEDADLPQHVSRSPRLPDAKICGVSIQSASSSWRPSSIDVQSGVSTTCYLPGPDTARARECWYINMGAVDKSFFHDRGADEGGALRFHHFGLARTTMRRVLLIHQNLVEATEEGEKAGAAAGHDVSIVVPQGLKISWRERETSSIPMRS